MDLLTDLEDKNASDLTSHCARVRVALKVTDDDVVSVLLTRVPNANERVECGLHWYDVRYVIHHAGTNADGIAATCVCVRHQETL